jgi:ABC-type transport system involved in cytochrome c biogenesis permease subunit
METLLSVMMLTAFGWFVRFLVPRARREHEAFALTCSVLAAVLALVCCGLFARGLR